MFWRVRVSRTQAGAAKTLVKAGDQTFSCRQDAPLQPHVAPSTYESEHVQGVDAAPMIAVAAGRGLWSAISARNEALLCIFPCITLVRLDGTTLGELPVPTSASARRTVDAA